MFWRQLGNQVFSCADRGGRRVCCPPNQRNHLGDQQDCPKRSHHVFNIAVCDVQEDWVAITSSHQFPGRQIHNCRWNYVRTGTEDNASFLVANCVLGKWGGILPSVAVDFASWSSILQSGNSTLWKQMTYESNWMRTLFLGFCSCTLMSMH